MSGGPVEATMLGCHGCQELLLDFLYDLLDQADQRPLLDHLAGCPACQAALESARAQQKLLAQAARLSFPDVRFTPPTEAPPEPAPPAQVLLPRRPSLAAPGHGPGGAGPSPPPCCSPSPACACPPTAPARVTPTPTVWSRNMRRPSPTPVPRSRSRSRS